MYECVSNMCVVCFCFFFNDTATTEIYTLSLHDALPISAKVVASYYNTRQKKAGVLYRLSGDLLILVGAAKTGTNICFVIIDEKPIREKTSGVFSGALSPKIGSKKFWNKIKPGFVKMYTYSPEGWQLLEGEEVDSAISLFFGGSHTKAGGA